MAQPLLSIDIRHPLVLKSNELVLLTREDGNVPLDIPGFGLFYRDTCYLGGYELALHDTKPLLLMSADGEGMGAQIELTNSALSTAKGEPYLETSCSAMVPDPKQDTYSAWPWTNARHGLTACVA